MLKFLAAVAMLGSMLGAGGGTLVAKVRKPVKKPTRVQIALGKPGAKNTLAVPGVAMAAGDQLQRPFDLLSKGAPIARVALSTSASPASVLVSDPVNGLRLSIDRCTKSWKRVAATRRYTCGGVRRTVVASRPAIGSNVALLALNDLRARKGTAHLLLRLTLPATAPNTLQGASASMTYRFTAAQAVRKR